LPVTMTIPIGLIVSLGGCDIHTKIEVAHQLLQLASPSLKYIVFYNNDPDNNDGIVPITAPDPDSGVTIPDNIGSLSFLSVSTSAGVNLMGLIQKYSESTNTTSQFLVEGNEDWDLAMLVQRLANTNNMPISHNRYDDSTSGLNSEKFFWFRSVLFALLIISPCCRGAYLWWNGGGRISFRRNGAGRIIGIQYVPPAVYWFAPPGIQNARSPISDRLTEEQVMALPEVVYKSSAETKSDAYEDTTGGAALSPRQDDVLILVSSGSAEEEIVSTQPQPPMERAPSVSESVSGSDEEHILEGSFETNFTTCSICIEEFETGERLRLLPRCKHVFHTECILPWLTERQGCCPLCKTSVVGQDEGGNEGPAHALAEAQNDDRSQIDVAGSVASTGVSTDVSSTLTPEPLRENVQGDEGPMTTDTAEDHPFIPQVTPDQDGTIRSQADLPKPRIEHSEVDDGLMDAHATSEDSQQEVKMVAVSATPSAGETLPESFVAL
jgi:Ring finger domain